MISQMQNMAGPGTLQAAEALGWGWSSAETSRSGGRHSLFWRGITILGWIACAAALTVLLGFLAFVYSLERVEIRPETRTDGIVALTGGAERVGDAIDLLAQGYATRLLITGVNERTSRASIARLNPGQRRLFDCCVDLDYRARNTIGNAIETRRWTESHRFRSIIVVTSTYHMPRTLVELDHAMPGVRIVPYAVVTETADPDEWWHNPATARILLSEYLKLLLVWTRTRFEGDPERSTAANLMSGGTPVKILAEQMIN
jgi:uncharacterized SAM-binding protein YcdF (DUF218 family)